jgi:hypothetical protein
VRGYFYFCDENTPHYPDWSFFGSRNWHKGDGTPIPPFGEKETVRQTWRDGSFPTIQPDKVRIGTQDCIEVGTMPETPPAALIAGVDIRCWQKRPPWGGLKGGGQALKQGVLYGGLAGGGVSSFRVLSGGLKGGGKSLFYLKGGGLAGGGDSHFQTMQGGLRGGGKSGFIWLRQKQFLSAQSLSPCTRHITWPVATQGGSLLVVIATGIDTAGAANPIATPGGWSKAKDAGGTAPWIGIFYLRNAPSQTVTPSFTESVIGQTCGLMLTGLEIVGSATVGSFDHAGSATGSSSDASTGSTGALSDNMDFCVGAVATYANATFGSPTNGFTIREQGANPGIPLSMATVTKQLNSTASQSCTLTPSLAKWVGVIAAF